MARSRSESAVEAPCMGTPPAIEILVVLPLLFRPNGPGVDARELGFDLGFGFGIPRSDTSVPVADGGALEEWVGGVADLIGGALLGPALMLEGVELPDFLPPR